MDDAVPHSGIVALVGRANAGKSTLMNRMLEEKVSIVSNIAQTTRNLIRGIRTEERGQLVFLDTPGVHRAKHDLGRIMNRTARMSVEGSDIALLVLDSSCHTWDEDKGWMKKLCRAEARLVFALNKHDLGGRHSSSYRELWRATAEACPPSDEPDWHEVSARTGRGVDELLDRLFALVPPGPLLFPEDVLTDFPRKWNIADVIREKLFAELYDELPHSVAVLVDGITEEGDTWRVSARVLVDKPTQKGMVIGHKGRLLRKVKRQAQAELCSMYGRDIALELWVKVQKDWARNHFVLRQLGYV